ncbi:MAG: DUF99 family protein, partial [Thermoproteota archaeon]
ELKLKTGFKVFFRNVGMDDFDSKNILNKFTVFGRIPEPIRVARLLARSIVHEAYASEKQASSSI